MTDPIADGLSRAFAAASLAAARCQVFALKAEAEGRHGLARSFSAAAASAAVHARRFMRVLRGRIGPTEANRAVCLGEMLPGLADLYGACLASPAVKGQKVAAEVFSHAASATDRIREVVAGAPSAAGALHVCQVCGWIAAEGAPERCPVCNAVKAKFKALDG